VPGGRGRFLEGGLTSYNTDLQVAALLAPAGTIAAYRKLENGKSLCGGGGGPPSTTGLHFAAVLGPAGAIALYRKLDNRKWLGRLAACLAGVVAPHTQTFTYYQTCDMKWWGGGWGSSCPPHPDLHVLPDM
jgi:hypothetical protein